MIALTAALVAQSAAAQTGGGSLMAECANLLKPTQESLRSNRVSELAVLRTVNSSSKDKGETNASGEVFDYFKASYGSKQEAERQLSTLDSLHWTDDEFRNYVAAYVPKQAYPAYNACVATVLGSPGLHLKIDSAEGSDLVVTIHFKGAEGTTGPYHLQIETRNTDKTLIDLPNVPASGFSRTFILTKIDKRKRVTVVGNAIAGPASASPDVLRIPPALRTVAQTSYRTLSVRAPDRVVCSGNGSGDPREGPEYGPPPLSAGEQFVPTATQVNVVDRGSWDNNQYLSNPPFFALTENSKSRIRAKTICMPKNIDSQTWLTTELTYQIATTTFRAVYAD